MRIKSEKSGKIIFGDYMGLIQCAEKCKYQKEGYCNLDKPSTVSLNNSVCPYYEPNSFDDGNGFLKTSDADKL